MAQALHWLTAALALAVLPLAWVAISLPPTPAKGSLFVLHKSVGLTILAIVVLRIVWRMIRPAPPDPQAPRLLTLIGRINHYLLYAIFLIMPISGYLLSALSGRDTPYFWLFTIPGLHKDEARAEDRRVDPLVGQWFVYALVLLHIAGTVLAPRDPPRRPAGTDAARSRTAAARPIAAVSRRGGARRWCRPPVPAASARRRSERGRCCGRAWP